MALLLPGWLLLVVVDRGREAERSQSRGIFVFYLF